ARCAFRTAEQARPETRGFSRRRGRPESAVFALRRARRADAAAVDAGGFDAHVEAPVKALVLGDAGRVAGIGVQIHAPNMGRRAQDVSPDSDMHPNGPAVAAKP